MNRYHVTPAPAHEGAPRWSVRKPNGHTTIASGTESVAHELAASLNERFGL